MAAADFETPQFFSYEYYLAIDHWGAQDWSKQLLKRIHLQHAIDIAINVEPELPSALRALRFPQISTRVRDLLSAPFDSTIEFTRGSPIGGVASPTLAELKWFVDRALAQAKKSDGFWKDVCDAPIDQFLPSAEDGWVLPWKLCRVAVASTAGNAQLGFKKWFKDNQVKTLRGGKDSRQAWADYGVIPYFDLKLICKWQGRAEANASIARALSLHESQRWSRANGEETEGYLKQIFQLAVARRLADEIDNP